MTPIEVVQAIYAGGTSNSDVGLFDLIDPDVVITQAGALPWGGRFDGHDGVMQWMGKLGEYIRSQVFADAYFESGDCVVERGRSKGTVVATGREFEVAEVHVWTVRNEKIASVEFYIDTPAMLEALGARA